MKLKDIEKLQRYSPKIYGAGTNSAIPGMKRIKRMETIYYCRMLLNY